MKVNTNIDVGLAILCIVAQPGDQLSAQKIAEVCECSTVRIQQIQAQALKKLKRNLFLRDFLIEDKNHA